MKKIIIALFLLYCPAYVQSEVLTMVRDPTTYEYVLDTLNNPVVRTTITGAATLLPEAAAAVGLTVSAGVTLPLSAAVLGTAWLSQDLYNKQNIKREWYNPPLYAEMSSVPTAKDFICQPAHISMELETVTPQSFPSVENQLLGRPCFLSTPLGDFLDYLNNDPSAPQSLRDITSPLATPGIGDGTPLVQNVTSIWAINPTGNIFSGPSGNYVIGNGYWQYHSTAYITSASASSFISGPKVSINFLSGPQQYVATGYAGLGTWNGVPRLYLWATSSYLDGTVDAGKGQLLYWKGPYTSTTELATFPPGQGSYDYPALKAALKNYFQTNPDSVSEAFKNIDPKNIAITDKVPTSTDQKPWTQTGPISQQEVNNYLTKNATNVANYNTTNITSTSSTTEIAQGNAAVEAAKAAANNLPKSATVQGTADLPDLPSYDGSIVQPVEISFVDRVHAFLNSGLPVLGSIRSSGLTSSGSPTMSCDLWGHHVQVDFSGQQGVLRSAGILLVSLATLYSFLIIVRS